MADILVIFSPDKQSAARQIESALGAAGYGSVLEEVTEPDPDIIAAKASAFAASLLIWSRPLASSAFAGGAAASLRRLPNLIEVSTDGIAPHLGDENRVVLLSGWRGQPFHLGWQRVLKELESRGASGRPSIRPAVAPAAAPAAADPQPRPNGASPGSKEAAPARRTPRLVLPALAALALLGVIGATWIASSGPAPEGARGRISSPAPTQAPAAQPAAPAPAPASPVAPAPPPQPLATAAASSGERSAPPPEAKAARRPPAAAAQPARRRSAGNAPPKRYSKRGERTMRAFCARSGRSTPECRAFARSAPSGR